MVCTALSSQSKPCVLQAPHKGGKRLVARPVPFSGSTTTAPRSVQMQAKGKGAARRMQSPTAPAGQMVRPPVPEVDPENEEFCIFTRASSGTYQNWIFVSVVKGGSAANTLVKSLETEWGRKLYGRTLIQNIGNAVYKDRDAIVKGLKGQIKQTLQYSNMAPQARLMEPLLNQPVTAFEFAFKIRDKSRPGEFQKAENLTIIPKESDIAQLPLDKFRQFFDPANLFGSS